MLKVRGHKYGAVKTVVDGITFDSKREANRYCELKLLEKAGEIRNLKLQPSFLLLVETPVRNDVLIGKYRGDFEYEECGGVSWDEPPHQRVVEDVKGFKTPLYKWKKKHVEAQYGIIVREV